MRTGLGPGAGVSGADGSGAGHGGRGGRGQASQALGAPYGLINIPKLFGSGGGGSQGGAGGGKIELNIEGTLAIEGRCYCSPKADLKLVT